MGESPRHPLSGKLGGPKGQSGRLREEINLVPLSGMEPRFLGRPLHNLVITLTVLSLLLGYLETEDKNAICTLGFCDSRHTILSRNSLPKGIFGPRGK